MTNDTISANGIPVLSEIEILKLGLENVGHYIHPKIVDVLTVLPESTPGFQGEAIQQVLKNIQHLRDGKTIVLSGIIGGGKTVAMFIAAIFFSFQPSYPYRIKKQWLFRTSYDVLKDAFGNDLRELAREQSLLLIDDLGYEHFSDKGWGIAEWDMLFDTRYRYKLPTLITTNLTPDEFIEKYNRRIYDRLKETAIWIEVAGESMRKPQ
jgi:DNA replication protein DnaC